MEILTQETIKTMTGYSAKAKQETWFKERGYTYQTDKDGNIWTTDDWMNGKDKYQQPDNDDGFNLEGLESA